LKTIDDIEEKKGYSVVFTSDKFIFTDIIVKYIKCERCGEEVEILKDNVAQFIKDNTCNFCGRFLCLKCKLYNINFPFCDDCEEKSIEFFREKSITKKNIIEKRSNIFKDYMIKIKRFIYLKFSKSHL